MLLKICRLRATLLSAATHRNDTLKTRNGSKDALANAVDMRLEASIEAYAIPTSEQRRSRS